MPAPKLAVDEVWPARLTLPSPQIHECAIRCRTGFSAPTGLKWQRPCRRAAVSRTARPPPGACCMARPMRPALDAAARRALGALSAGRQPRSGARQRAGAGGSRGRRRRADAVHRRAASRRGGSGSRYRRAGPRVSRCCAACDAALRIDAGPDGLAAAEALAALIRRSPVNPN